VALAWLEAKPAALGDVEGFDISLFERHVSPDINVVVNNSKLSLRSEPKSLFHFDFQSGGPFPAGQAEVTLTARGGAANGVVRWIRLKLDDEIDYENKPGPERRSHWAALFWPLPAGDLEEGASVVLHAAHDRERVTLWTA
jgi:protein arginine N-methyltransferase 7